MRKDKIDENIVKNIVQSTYKGIDMGLYISAYVFFVLTCYDVAKVISTPSGFEQSISILLKYPGNVLSSCIFGGIMGNMYGFTQQQQNI
jgi:hypothetical protein